VSAEVERLQAQHADAV
jgi:FtsZ-binding cell division protein ZapB